MSTTATLSSIQDALGADYLTPGISLDRQVEHACASDLMSDVLAFSEPKSFLLTGLASPQTVRTAEVADLIGICFVFGKEPSQETITMAEESGIPLFKSPFSLYTASGMLFRMGIPGCQHIR